MISGTVLCRKLYVSLFAIYLAIDLQYRMSLADKKNVLFYSDDALYGFMPKKYMTILKLFTM